MWKSLIQLGQKENQFGGVIFESKLTQNHPSFVDKKKKWVTGNQNKPTKSQKQKQTKEN